MKKWIIIGAIILISVIIWQIDADDRTLLNISSIIGSIASLCGVIIAISEISSIKKISEITQNTIAETRSKLIQRISISDISKARNFIKQSQDYIRKNEYELAYLRLDDLRPLLEQFHHINEFTKLQEYENYRILLKNMNVSIVSIRDYKGKKEINTSKINKNLDEILAVLIKFENHLKYED